MIAKRLLLVDGTQLFYRSFFGIRELSTSAGQPSNAVFGFVRGIHQLIELWTPSHIAVTWDGGVPAARLALLPEYKAQRPPMPDALRQQYEPDAEEIMIVTADKDLYQLVSDRVVMVTWGKDDKRMGRAEVFAKTGVYPEQIVDWLAMTGDTVDNIPGVEGVGPKTAAKLLGQHGSLAALWPRIETVTPPRIHDALLAARERVERNLSLVKLQDALDCFPGWDTLVTKAEQPSRMRAFYARMEFHSLIQGCDQGELF
jgi:DNA polymerase I